MRAGLEPFAEDHRLLAAGARGDDVRSLNHGAGLIAEDCLDSQILIHLLGKPPPVLGVWAIDLDLLNPSHLRDQIGVRPCHPSRSQNPQDRSVLPRHVPRRQRHSRRHAHVLQVPVVEHGEESPVFRVEKQDHAEKAAGKSAVPVGPVASKGGVVADHVRLDTDRNHLHPPDSAFHRAVAVPHIRVMCGDKDICFSPIHRRAQALFFVCGLKHRHAILGLQDLLCDMAVDQ